MAAIARANAVDSVLSPDGKGKKCAYPLDIKTGAASQSKVFADGTPVAVIGDIVMPHPRAGCSLDTSSLSSASSRVFAAGKGVARIGDSYGNNRIISGSSRCFSN